MLTYSIVPHCFKQPSFYIATGLTFLVGLTIGIILPIDILPPQTTTFQEQRNASGYRFINPLLDCDTANFSNDNILNPLRSSITKVINNNLNNHTADFISVYYRDLNNGPWVGINEKEDFSPSSLIKVPLMIAYYKIAESNPDILNQELLNTQTYNPKDQNFTPEVSLAPQQKYTVDTLIDRMIMYSDNLAYNLLNDYLDTPTLISVYNDLGVDISKGFTDPDGNILTVKAYASFFRILFNASYLDPEYSEKALRLLSQSKFKRGLVAGLPQDIIVAHKFGERQYLPTGQKQLHDCGIIYLPKKPYLLCIMTRGNDFSNLTTIIKEISNTIYRAIEPQN